MTIIKAIRKYINYKLFRLAWYFLCGLRWIVERHIKDEPSNLPPISDRILLMTAVELADSVRNGQISCAQVAAIYLKRVRDVNPIVNAICDMNEVGIKRTATELDQRLADERAGLVERDYLDRPLVGVPVTIKNSIAVKDLTQDGGIPNNAGHCATRDSQAVRRLRNAGCMILGITNVPEALNWYETKNHVHGITKNPYILTRMAAGSSGGEGAALGSACSLVGVGSDMLGSCRMPAHCCGVFGHKPTNGVIVSLDGLVPPYGENLWPILTLGPMTRYASDLRPMLAALCEPEGAAQMRLNDPVDFRKLKFYYCDDSSIHPTISPVSDEVRATMRKAINYFENKYEVTFKRITLSKLKMVDTLWLAGIKELDQTRQKTHLFGPDSSKHPNIIFEIIKSFFNLSPNYTYSLFVAALEDVSAKEHIQAKLKGIREDFKAEVRKAIGKHGVLFHVTMPEVAYKTHTTLFRPADVGYSGVMNVLELPATHATMGLDAKSGLPIGFGIAAAPYNDRFTLAVAEELEREFGGWVSPGGVQLTDNATVNSQLDHNLNKTKKS